MSEQVIPVQVNLPEVDVSGGCSDRFVEESMRYT